MRHEQKTNRKKKEKRVKRIKKTFSLQPDDTKWNEMNSLSENPVNQPNQKKNKNENRNLCLVFGA